MKEQFELLHLLPAAAQRATVAEATSPDACSPGSTPLQPPIGKRSVARARKSKAKAGLLTLRAGALGSSAMPRPERKTVQATARDIGRAAGGPACIGCHHYQRIETGSGNCTMQARVVRANYRGPCGLYVFWPLDVAKVAHGSP